MRSPLLSVFLESSRNQFRAYKKLAEGAMEQIDDAAFLHKDSPDSNSIAVLIRHLAGNMRSRWTDFFTSDGEKPWRKRDEEFEDAPMTREELMREWEDGWKVLLDTVDSMKPSDLGRTVMIRGEKLGVIRAVQRSLTHTAYHVGQIVHVAKARAPREWKSLSIPKRKPGDASSDPARIPGVGGEARPGGEATNGGRKRGGGGPTRGGSGRSSGSTRAKPKK